uniref:Putative secreted peptide n=1 Tax=Anopheles braziliensis TaxID=58242 RepID=A0A2M3ZVM2_9DIPT
MRLTVLLLLAVKTMLERGAFREATSRTGRTESIRPSMSWSAMRGTHVVPVVLNIYPPKVRCVTLPLIRTSSPKEAILRSLACGRSLKMEEESENRLVTR